MNTCRLAQVSNPQTGLLGPGLSRRNRIFCVDHKRTIAQLSAKFKRNYA